ncbi:hypothetical protein FGG08_006094 [Glutinoglossum americanum]|uniref:CCAAT-binding factor domain-containing protein n=1 Tax=Glutinoglossum americanum TaxID=1670608 RepID=A0A9P8I5Z6_9PEZI|nr:hypothetical protein FGG08_006094 [Glutinoglossum americanum]
MLDPSTPSKKRKRGDNTGPCKLDSKTADDNNAQSRILQLESQILESRRYYNNIATLLLISRGDDPQNGEKVAAAVSLCRVFCRLLANGGMLVTTGAADAEAMVVRWLNERYDDYSKVLLTMLKEPNISQGTALTLLMRLVKDEGNRPKAGQERLFPRKLYSRILRVVLEAQCTSEAREELVRKYINRYDDIRIHTMAIIYELATEGHPLEVLQAFISNTLSVLSSTQVTPPSKDDIDKFYATPTENRSQLSSITAYKKQAQQAWLALFKLGLSKEQRKIILGLISSKIAPCFVKPELLMDFLTDSLNFGGSMSLLALSGLFYLIQEKNLDYPMFYQKLYIMLDASIMHSRHRSRFFRLLDTFLASTHLPAALVASFIKKLSRLSLQAPPAGIVVVVPWIYNLLKRHPTCTFMIHREIHEKDRSEQLRGEVMNDPFDFDEEDPVKTDAISSSLWEIQMLQAHYHPNVATLARIISEQFTKHSYNTEDFLDHSYATMLDMELSKDIKKPPVVESEIPEKIFTGYCKEAVQDDPLIVKMWDFT